MDKFEVLRKRAKRALKEYEDLRKKLDVKEPMLLNTIQREAQPFVKGRFTLAVVGEMSAGKSTFINALLGQRGLLPSAYGQTTCVLTEIIDSDKATVEVTFADGKTKTMSSEMLHNLVAIPSDYENIPVNEVNRLIKDGKTFEDIRKRKADLSALQNNTEIDEAILKDYVKKHDKSNIPEKVVVKYPLPEAYKGWRIVDTPGVGAVGGIEKATKDFINSKDKNDYNNVDAIIFVNSGRLQMQRSGFNQFVEDTFNTIYEEARKRIFLIITHAADPKFIDNEEEEIKRAKNLFIDKYKLREDRLVCVDSICSLFYEYVKEYKLDLQALKKKDVPAGWSQKDWANAIETRNVFKNIFDEEGIDPCNENYFKYYEEYSGIIELREMLNDFAEQEKMKVFQNLMKHINKDITALRLMLKKNEETLGLKLKSTKDKFAAKVAKEKEKLAQLQTKKDSSLHTIRVKYSKQSLSERFHDIDNQVLNLRIEDAIYKVQNKADLLLHQVEDKQKEIYDELSSEFEQSFDSMQSEFDIPLPTIDFPSITKKAHKDSVIETPKAIAWEQKKTESIVGGVKRFFGGIFGNRSWGYENDYSRPTKWSEEKVDHDKELLQFKGHVVSEFTKELSQFIDSISTKIDSLGKEISKVIDEKIEIQQSLYDEVLNQDNTTIVQNEYNRVSEMLKKTEQTLKTMASI